MPTPDTPPATKQFCVWADHVRRVYQHVEADSPAEAYRLASDRPESWETCGDESRHDYRLTNEVLDLATEEFIAPEGHRACRTCGIEIVHGVNGSNFGDGECGSCEYARYRSQPGLHARCAELATAADAFLGSRAGGDLDVVVRDLARVALETKSFLTDTYGNAA